MGCGQSAAKDTNQEVQPKTQEKPVEKQPEGIQIRPGEFDKEDIKILILGAGECGKSTLWRQIKILHCNGFNDQERKAFRRTIRSTVVEDIKVLIEELETNNNNVSEDIQEKLEFVKDADPLASEFDEELAEAISAVWHDPMIQVAFHQSNSLGLGENTAMFLDNVNKIAEDNYMPTNEEILKARIRTVGKSDLQFYIDNYKTLLVDVGGQKNERQNWNKCFQGVHFLLFVVSLSDFDQVMFEDGSTRRTQDAQNLFAQIVSTGNFKETPVFLVLNKLDVFKDKLQKSPEAFAEAYPGYTGSPTDYNQAVEHVKKTFLDKVSADRSGNAWIEVIPTCAMDQSQVSAFIQTMAKKIVEQG